MENNLCCPFNKIAERTPGLCKSLQNKTDDHLLLLDISGQVSNLEQKHENAKKASSQSVSTGKVEEVTNIFASAGDIERPMDREQNAVVATKPTHFGLHSILLDLYWC